MVRAPIRGIDYSPSDSVWRHPYRALLIGVAGLNAFAGFFCVVSFLVAESPAHALAERKITLPINWEAGVWNHGAHYEWYLISEHPAIFAAALVWFAAAIFVFDYLQRDLRDALSKGSAQ